MPRLDLHTHSWLSPDGGLQLQHFEHVFARGLLDVVAVTDHNTIEAALSLQQRFGERIIVGEEISTTQGDIIGLFLKQAVPAGLTAAEAARRIRSQGGLVYVPHPFERFRKSGGGALDMLADVIDIVEVYNGRTVLQRHNVHAADWAAAHRLPGAASSDAHGMAGWGKTYTQVAATPTRENLCTLLASAVRVTKRPGVRMLLYPKVNRVRHFLQPLAMGTE